jgi:hypothetical protein
LQAISPKDADGDIGAPSLEFKRYLFAWEQKCHHFHKKVKRASYANPEAQKPEL